MIRNWFSNPKSKIITDPLYYNFAELQILAKLLGVLEYETLSKSDLFYTIQTTIHKNGVSEIITPDYGKNIVLIKDLIYGDKFKFINGDKNYLVIGAQINIIKGIKKLNAVRVKEVGIKNVKEHWEYQLHRKVKRYQKF